ncbi:hypothetical protein ACWD4N_43400 [Streptomyces sp. NPDC002586]
MSSQKTSATTNSRLGVGFQGITAHAKEPLLPYWSAALCGVFTAGATDSFTFEAALELNRKSQGSLPVCRSCRKLAKTWRPTS